MFLRFETPRLRVALPYASLLMLELALNEEQLDLMFATHRVTVRGRKLGRTYQAVCEGMATQVTAATNELAREARWLRSAPWVGEIRLESVKCDDRELR